tara:strand:- start:167 stop:442 length:276 start_codon:yes stop_codon:yes gene_type:complete
MTIKITKTIEVKTEKKLNLDNIWVARRNTRDIDSINLDVYYDNEEIGYGHLNNRTNFAHITINENLLNEEDECELIDYLVDGIENRTIRLG